MQSNILINTPKEGCEGKNTKYNMSYNELKKFVQEIYYDIKSKSQWRREFHNNKKRLHYIPANPEAVYKNRGWVSWGDFLGTKRIQSNIVAHQLYVDYKEAKEMLQEYKFKSRTEFKEKKINSNFCTDIPYRPERYYKNKGWVSWNDFLSNNNIANQLRKLNFKSYNEAKDFLKTINPKITSRTSFVKFHELNNIIDIPKQPEKYYKNNGWISWGDFLNKSDLNR